MGAAEVNSAATSARLVNLRYTETGEEPVGSLDYLLSCFGRWEHRLRKYDTSGGGGEGFLLNLLHWAAIRLVKET